MLYRYCKSTRQAVAQLPKNLIWPKLFMFFNKARFKRHYSPRTLTSRQRQGQREHEVAKHRKTKSSYIKTQQTYLCLSCLKGCPDNLQVNGLSNLLYSPCRTKLPIIQRYRSKIYSEFCCKIDGPWPINFNSFYQIELPLSNGRLDTSFPSDIKLFTVGELGCWWHVNGVISMTKNYRHPHQLIYEGTFRAFLKRFPRLFIIAYIQIK